MVNELPTYPLTNLPITDCSLRETPSVQWLRAYCKMLRKTTHLTIVAFSLTMGGCVGESDPIDSEDVFILREDLAWESPEFRKLFPSEKIVK